MFVDSNLPGIQTLGRAKALGHPVTLPRGTEYTMYAATPATQSVLASLDHVVEMDVTSNVQQVPGVALDLARKTPFDAIVTQHDYPSESAAAVAEALKLPFMSPQAVRNARCKEEARRLLDATGIPSARWALINNVTEALRATEEIGLPVVVKPSSGSDSILAARCDTPQQVAVAVESIFDGREKLPRQMREQLSRGILVEEHLRGSLVSAEIAIHGGKHLGHSRTEPPSPRRFATTRKVMLAQVGTLSDRCSPAELAAITSDMDVFDAPGIRPSARVARHRIVARLVASVPSMEAADARANKALRDLSELRGVPRVQ